MQLLDIQGHMPFLYEDSLYFCASRGKREFTVKSLEHALRNDRPPQTVAFQPWELAVYRDGVVTYIRHTFRTNDPVRIFCNPVMGDGVISFVYGRRLYTAQIINDCLARVVEVADKLFTGFFMNFRLVTGIPPCARGRAQLIVDGVKYVTGFSELLRVIPHGSGMVLTGQTQGSFWSMLVLADGTSSRITVNGCDVYKCCLTPNSETVIHAVRGKCGERYLHSDPVTLLASENFLTETN